jgi:hypothetical protein
MPGFQTTFFCNLSLKLCLQSYIKDACSCLDASLPNIYRDSSYCDSIQEFKCVDDARASYLNDQSARLCLDSSTKMPSCPLECDSVGILQTYSRSRYPSTYYTNYLRRQTNLLTRFPLGTPNTDNYIQKNIVMLNVFYSDISTTRIEETPAMTDMVGNVGGTFGLFLGMSLLGFVEIVEIIVDLTILWIRRRVLLTHAAHIEENEMQQSHMQQDNAILY